MFKAEIEHYNGGVRVKIFEGESYLGTVWGKEVDIGREKVMVSSLGEKRFNIRATGINRTGTIASLWVDEVHDLRKLEYSKRGNQHGER